jgi:hypothetical protein
MLAGLGIAAAASACAAPSAPAPAERTSTRVAVPERDGLAVLEHRAQPAPALNASRRNIFRERDRAAAAPAGAIRVGVPAEPVPSAPPIPPAPVVTLLGLAETNEGGRVVRTAVISTGGELWMVKEGDTVAGRYRVAAVAADRVDLKDVQSGTLRSYHLR